MTDPAAPAEDDAVARDRLRRRIAARFGDIQRMLDGGVRWKDVASALAEQGITASGGAPLQALELLNHVTAIRRGGIAAEPAPAAPATASGPVGTVEPAPTPAAAAEPVHAAPAPGPAARAGADTPRPAPAPNGGTPAAADIARRRHTQGNDGAMTTGTIVVCNDRGGLGKTLLANFLLTTAAAERLPARLVEYDVTSRLEGHFSPDLLEWRRISQDFGEIMAQGADALFHYWDPLAPELQRGGQIVDFGANVSGAFFDWADLSGLDHYVGDGGNLTFMVPVTADVAAMRTALITLNRIAAVAPKARRILVENGHGGLINGPADSEYNRRKAEWVRDGAIEVLAMPACAAAVWPRIAGQRLSRLAQIDRGGLMGLGVEPPLAARSAPLVRAWVGGMMETLRPVVAHAFRR